MTWSEAENMLNKMALLGDDWDGNGEVAPTPEIINSAVRLLQIDEFRNRMKDVPPTRVMPRALGGVLLEWFSSDCDYYLTAWIDAPGRADWTEINGEQARHWSEPIG